eukprot:562530_1
MHHVTNTELIRTAWWARTFYVVDVVVITKLLWSEYMHRKQSNDHTWLSTFRMITLISALLLSVVRLCAYTPLICNWTIQFLPLFMMGKNVSLTFYQITRLKRAFSREHLDDSQHKKHGYNKYVFIGLYTSGILLMVPCCYATAIELFSPSFTSARVEPIPYFGCEWRTGDNHVFQAYTSITGVWYLIWDIGVLLMYIKGMVQINKAIVLNNKTVVYHKIKAILKKMISLTVCYELLSLLSLSLVVMDSDSRYTIHGTFLFSLECMVAVFVLYFMAEHNNDKYFKCVHTFAVIFCCCCTDSKVNKQSETHVEQPDLCEASKPKIGRINSDNNTDNNIYTETTKGKHDDSEWTWKDSNELTNAAESDLSILSAWKTLNHYEQMHIYLCVGIFVIQFSIFIVVLVVLLNHI